MTFALDRGRHLICRFRSASAPRAISRRRPVYSLCRGIIAVSRCLQEILYAIFFVAMFGFGTFAGFLTISFATIGFLGKLLAEDIEDIDEARPRRFAPPAPAGGRCSTTESSLKSCRG